MAKRVWRIQADIPVDENDPLVTCFVGKVEIDEDTGAQIVRQDTANPISVPLSKIHEMLAGNHQKAILRQTEAKAEAKAAADAAAVEAAANVASK